MLYIYIYIYICVVLNFKCFLLSLNVSITCFEIPDFCFNFTKEFSIKITSVFIAATI